MNVDKDALKKIRESAADILMAVGKIESALLARESWPGATAVVMFSLGEITGSAIRMQGGVARIIDEQQEVAPDGKMG